MASLLSRTLRRFRSDQRGTVLIEMAIVGPLMLLLSAGVFEFGNLIHDKMLMEAGLSDGARFAARCNSQLYTDAGLAAIDCADLAKNITVFGNVAGTAPARLYGWQKSDVTISIADPATCKNAIDPGTGTVLYLSTTSQVCIVTASGTYAYSSLDSAGLLSLLNITTVTLGASHQERLIRF
ncbi:MULTISPECIES: TadE/TadG family type IV pilus assembly protein [unclassified Mesorhizobium]|uniref:TadE/TadG family type IV pilus assembly protein n=1 Tax=unclassified Mesorhizobium TaxID=325217 RepID=UPI000BAF9003|nr:MULTISPECIES: TadE/TadG family type IV pilus assembly protein [unclassified Mesorhizobium]PBB85173.1 pilus assembly protein TadE [Mesorhizobium sp. WSM3876]RWB66615.1 MAG: pilus assembly protein [Mesorhizobium sp.]RWB83324.1 MAG: pilus assembly protein [Mesorhizobium sp.]TGS64966.1 pilus assembly protein [Mesorhizobium sp. M3A.F.Ca.ET.201.01.1.1]TGS82773.1 pilus assembly protein [Mesorhizobium sp. M3A.F.Ca.ET.175.01.1.1]